MEEETLSLQDLRDLIIPPAPPLWPLAPGLWIALGVVTLLLALLVWTVLSRRRRNAYRRAGLSLLKDARTTHEASVILKRVALVAYPREQVASLHGDEWISFLASSCPEHSFGPLAGLAPAAPLPPTALSLARTWITHHRPAKATT